MAITPTGAIYKTLTFDGQSSGTYGVYITGNAVFNAPERAVEMITIPGRNGAFALDQGRFENIEVTYPAGIFADNEADFAEAVSEFRNFLCSRKGYVRLTDDYNPDEYRLAVYKSGLEVEPSFLRAGEFDITFECKPQRFLTSGEEAIEVTSGDTITNPTLFDASPFLKISGGGNISFNGYDIDIENSVYGDVEVLTGGQNNGVITKTITFNDNIANIGDTITVNKMRFSLTARAGAPVTYSSQSITGSGYNHDYYISNDGYSTYIEVTDVVFLVGTPANNKFSVRFTQLGNTPSMSIEFNYNGSGELYMKMSYGLLSNSTLSYWDAFILHSTKYFINSTIYIDTDIGTAYKYEGGEVVSLNQYIDLGSDLPTLAPGANTITYDNTITSFKITPRWWKV